MNKKTRIISLMLVLTLVIIPIQSVFAVEDSYEQVTDEELSYIKGMIEFVDKHYLYDVKKEQLIEGAIKGIFSELDKYSDYYTKEEFAKLIKDVSGEFVGVGIRIKKEGDYITVIAPIKNSPSQKVGIKPGDKIETVDQVDVKGYDIKDFMDLLLGEEGTEVKLGIKRDGINKTLYFNIKREVIELNPVKYNIMENNIGYIELSEFNKQTYKHIKEALDLFDKENIKDIIIDLRYNPGGYLKQVISVSRLFIPKGPIVHIKEPDGSMETYKSNLNKNKYNIAVLINSESASASEIFAAAIKDRKAGTLIGETTYGKGVVQRIVPLKNGDGIKLTMSEYLGPNKESINKIGVNPDILVDDLLASIQERLVRIPNFDFNKDYKLNSVGLDVLAAEELLDIMGYDIDKCDGIYDEKTYKSLRKFQRDNGIKDNGIIDKTTKQMLDSTLAKYLQNNKKDLQKDKAIEVLIKGRK
ncbi:S41 family peptidase [Dethiothermospora halolimnae]|uniref:S41 family peptidase n=1 Tax=Dethiothermospora halolimnae TaxID=3114390 RepID=UPI003CCC03B8